MVITPFPIHSTYNILNTISSLRLKYKYFLLHTCEEGAGALIWPIKEENMV